MPEIRSGFVAVVGRPNVGKSTLINTLLGQKVAAVSPRPQTTRRRQLGILSLPEAQIVFVDTPGLHQSRHKLGDFLNQEAEEALTGVDAILYLADASHDPQEEDERIASSLLKAKRHPPLLVGLNKVDLVTPLQAEARLQAYQALLPGSTGIRFSARNGTDCDALLAALLERMPVRQPDYPSDQLTDLYEREIAADLLREAALLLLRDEVPHGLAVRIDEFTERGETGAFIGATLFVERESQKGIVIGEKGGMLKKIGSSARQEIESMSGRKVYLELRVKVAPNWREDTGFLERLGYKLKKKKK